jgi:hypothetical protein
MHIPSCLVREQAGADTNNGTFQEPPSVINQSETSDGEYHHRPCLIQGGCSSKRQHAAPLDKVDSPRPPPSVRFGPKPRSRSVDHVALTPLTRRVQLVAAKAALWHHTHKETPSNELSAYYDNRHCPRWTDAHVLGRSPAQTGSWDDRRVETCFL